MRNKIKENSGISTRHKPYLIGKDLLQHNLSVRIGNATAKKSTSGITLIALIVTIVVLIILATISMNLLMNGNIIGRAEQASEIHARAAELERLELIKSVVALDNQGKVTVDDYIEEAIKEGVTTEDKVTDNGNGSKNIITDNGYNVNIAPDPDNENNVIITIDGEGTGDTNPDPVAVSKITLNAKSTRMAAGYTRTLIATVEPENATNKELEWTSTDTNLATVTDGGSGAFGIYGNVNSASGKTGKITVTAKAKDGSNVTASCEVEVVIAEEISTIVGETTAASSNRTMCDEYGNLITIPADFTVVANENFGTTYSYTGNTSSPSVQDGIVIKDSDDNQFTWIPAELVQNKTEDRNGPSKNIVLGRYTFDIWTGKETLEQNAEDYEKETPINENYQELTSYREGVESSKADGENATARDLEGFVTNTKANSGYYMGRYEASYRSGTSKTDYKPYCKESTTASTSKWENTPNRLWSYITQIDAAAASRNMYGDGANYASDLVNSYAWDTAIVYIQTYSDNKKYSNQNSLNTDAPSNTGMTEDKVCNIYDMASNMFEWTTEFSKTTESYSASPCVYRGGYYNLKGYYTTKRNYSIAVYAYTLYISFRPLCYIK